MLALLYSMLHGIYCTLHVRRFVIDVISSFPYDEVLQGESAGLQAKTSKAAPYNLALTSALVLRCARLYEPHTLQSFSLPQQRCRSDRPPRPAPAAVVDRSQS